MTRRLFRFATVVLSISLICFSASATVPVQEFVARPSLVSPVVSPNGRYVAFGKVGDDGRTAVLVVDLEAPAVAATSATIAASSEVDWIAWANDDRLLAGVSVEIEVSIRNLMGVASARVSRVLAFDRDGRNDTRLFDNFRRMQARSDLSEVVHPLPQDKDHVLMAAWDEGRRYSLYRVNVVTGAADLVVRGGKNTFQWLTDFQGTPRVRWDGRKRGPVEMRVRRGDSDDWDLALRYSEREYPDLKIVGFADDPRIAIVADRQGGDRFGLFEYQLAARALGKPLLQHPKVDVGWPVGGPIYDPYTTGLLGATFVDDVWYSQYFDAQLDKIQRKFQTMLADSAIVRLTSWSTDRQRFVVYAEGPRNPGAYFLYDVAKDATSSLGRKSPRLPASELGEVLVIKYPARDGTKIPGYLTLPPGKSDKNLPLVVMPHGGPELRDYVQFDSWAQLFANRGFAVFQPNFRGSGGYGRSYTEAGHRQWGLLMQDDISDGVKALIGDGTADPRRICIVGASYGGYAALAGGAFTPDLYKCIVSIAGVSDVPQMLADDKYAHGDDSHTYDYWKKWVGDPRVDLDRMKAISPINHAAKFVAPVLLIHGEEDDNVRVMQSIRMAKALRKAGKQVELVVVPYEGHTFESTRARLARVTDVERFVSAHIGH